MLVSFRFPNASIKWKQCLPHNESSSFCGYAPLHHLPSFKVVKEYRSLVLSGVGPFYSASFHVEIETIGAVFCANICLVALEIHSFVKHLSFLKQPSKVWQFLSFIIEKVWSYPTSNITKYNSWTNFTDFNHILTSIERPLKFASDIGIYVCSTVSNYLTKALLLEKPWTASSSPPTKSSNQESLWKVMHVDPI